MAKQGFSFRSHPHALGLSEDYHPLLCVSVCVGSVCVTPHNVSVCVSTPWQRSQCLMFSPPPLQRCRGSREHRHSCVKTKLLFRKYNLVFEIRCFYHCTEGLNEKWENWKSNLRLGSSHLFQAWANSFKSLGHMSSFFWGEQMNLVAVMLSGQRWRTHAHTHTHSLRHKKTFVTPYGQRPQ